MENTEDKVVDRLQGDVNELRERLDKTGEMTPDEMTAGKQLVRLASGSHVWRDEPDIPDGALVRSGNGYRAWKRAQ
jgi:hypothetical protein